MNHVIIDGIPPWDGRYPFDDFALSNGELFEIKKICGLRASELIEALDANDTGAYVAFAAVITARQDLRVDIDDLWKGKVGSIKIELGSADDADPPTTNAEPDGQSETDDSSGSVSESAGG